MIHALISGLQKKTIERLQLIQNSTARLWTRTKRREHISPVLAALHWLLVKLRIDFKVLLLRYKALNGHGWSYIADSLVYYVPSRTLRSSASSLLEVPNNSRKKIWDAAFLRDTPKLWNRLDIREASSVNIFIRKLKHLLASVFN